MGAGKNKQLILNAFIVTGVSDEEAQRKFQEYRSLGSISGALGLFDGWTGIELDKYDDDDDEELRNVQPNDIRSAVEGWSKASPGVPKLLLTGVTAEPYSISSCLLSLAN